LGGAGGHTSSSRQSGPDAVSLAGWSGRSRSGPSTPTRRLSSP